MSTTADFIAANPGFKTSMTVTRLNAYASLRKALGDFGESELSTNIAELVDMFCTLFELNRAGLRLSVLNHAMCPKFHVDHVPCRLVTTYQGIATEWLPHQLVDRSKLGRGSNGLADHDSKLFQSHHDIQQLSHGDAALLKGERWEGNQNAGLVHRSPVPPGNENRLLLTLDFSH